jgi:hypothetical protein
MPSRVQMSVGRRVQTTPAQKQLRLTLTLGYSFLREIMLLTRCQQNQVAAAAGDELHHLLHRAQAFLAETCEPRSSITLPQIRSYLNRWAQNQHRRTTLRLQLRKGRVYLWRVLHPTLLADTELVWQVSYALLDRLISSLAQWEQNTDGRRGWWQGRLQQVVGLAERFLDMTVELEPVYLDEQGKRLPFHPYLEHKRWLVVEVLPLTLLPVAELFSRLEALRRPVYLTQRPRRSDAQQLHPPGPIRVPLLRRRNVASKEGMAQRGRNGAGAQ